MSAQAPDRPWEGLDPHIATVLRPELPRLADEIVAAVSEGVPDYARPLEGPFGRDLRAGVEEALRQFLEMVERPGAGRSVGRSVYVGLGRAEMRAGRSLDALLAAYRIGARVAWRRLASAALAARVSPESLSLLAESIFAYIDELSGESVEGHAREQAAEAGERQRRRRRLAGLLLAPSAEPAAVETAAAEAGWELPGTLAVVAVAGAEPDRLAGRVGPDALGVSTAEADCVIVPDPDAPAARQRLVAAFRGASAALGPSVPWPEAPRSLARAASALRLVGRGALTARTLVPAEEHLGALLLLADPTLAAELDERRLGPLASLSPAARERARATLLSWLRHQGRLREVSEELRVHPQTVRYRMGRLRELVGDALDSPDGRFELELALRAEALGEGSP